MLSIGRDMVAQQSLTFAGSIQQKLRKWVNFIFFAISLEMSKCQA